MLEQILLPDMLPSLGSEHEQNGSQENLPAKFPKCIKQKSPQRDSCAVSWFQHYLPLTETKPNTKSLMGLVCGWLFPRLGYSRQEFPWS